MVLTNIYKYLIFVRGWLLHTFQHLVPFFFIRRSNTYLVSIITFQGHIFTPTVHISKHNIDYTKVVLNLMTKKKKKKTPVPR